MSGRSLAGRPTLVRIGDRGFSLYISITRYVSERVIRVCHKKLYRVILVAQMDGAPVVEMRNDDERLTKFVYELPNFRNEFSFIVRFHRHCIFETRLVYLHPI